MTDLNKTPVADAEIPNRGPRVAPADIEAEIASETYFTAAQGQFGARMYVDGTTPMPAPSALDLLTFCVLTLRNGFTVTGESAVASPENFNADIGKRLAREAAVRKIGPLLGFRLRDQLARASTPQPVVPSQPNLL